MQATQMTLLFNPSPYPNPTHLMGIRVPVSIVPVIIPILEYLVPRSEHGRLRIGGTGPGECGRPPARLGHRGGHDLGGGAPLGPGGARGGRGGDWGRGGGGRRVHGYGQSAVKRKRGGAELAKRSGQGALFIGKFTQLLQQLVEASHEIK